MQKEFHLGKMHQNDAIFELRQEIENLQSLWTFLQMLPKNQMTSFA